MMLRILIFSVAILLTTCWGGETSAAMISILGNDGIEHLGSFSGILSYDPSDAHTATLTISLTNTSPPANGGYLTAFAFNNPGNDLSGVKLSTSASFQLLGGSSKNKFQNTIGASPFGNFDLGASTSQSFLGGGNPKNGIAPGESVTFIFSLTGNHLDELNELSFVTALSDKTASPQFFVARFRGFNNGGSDKVPGFDPPIQTPLPSTSVLLGSALVGLMALSRFRKP